MSREVEVKNIQMTATTPEDIQLSIGALGVSNAAAATVAGKVSLTGSTGVLVKGSTKNSADDGQVLPPSTDAWNWSNTADISHYYSLGMLIPASSTTGEEIYFTPDADGVGQTIKSGAAFIRADSSVNGEKGVADSGTTTSYKTTLHAKTGESDNWSGTVSTQYNVTNDDGYYVDIPVWLRTSSSATTTLGVKAYVIPKTGGVANENGEALYKAVRVAILNGTQADGAASASGTTGLIAVADGMNGTVTKDNSGTISSTPFAGTSILNWYNHSGTVAEGINVTDNVAAKKSAGATASKRFDTNVYGAPTIYDVDAGFVTLSPGAGNDYGKATQVVIRVWLEGEDPDCWNDTAGQDWSINVKFHKIGTTPSESDINTASKS